MKTKNFKQCYESVHSVFVVVTCIICKFLFYFLRIYFIPGYPYKSLSKLEIAIQKSP